MKNLTIHSDLINHEIKIIYGFLVDYNCKIDSDYSNNYNNNGIWGKIINRGRTVISIKYNPNKTAPNFGEFDYESNLSYMKRQLLVLQSLQPNQIETIINN